MHQKRKVRTRTRIRIPTDVTLQQRSRYARHVERLRTVLIWVALLVGLVVFIWFTLDTLNKPR